MRTFGQRFQRLAVGEIESLKGFTFTNACKARQVLINFTLHTESFGEQDEPSGTSALRHGGQAGHLPAVMTGSNIASD